MQPKIDNTNVKPFVFVLMPFDSAFDDIYQLGIKAACLSAGTDCKRVDEQIFVENILERVYNQIAKADIVVSEMTGRNPNVFYETGYAHALKKRVILLTQNADDIPFDLKHYPHIIYGGKIAHLKTELEKRIRWFIDNPTQETTDANRFPNEFHDLIRELEERKELHNLLQHLDTDFTPFHNRAKALSDLKSSPAGRRGKKFSEEVKHQFSDDWRPCSDQMERLLEFAKGLKHIDDYYDPSREKGPKWMFELNRSQDALQDALEDRDCRNLVDASSQFFHCVNLHLMIADDHLRRVVKKIMI